MKHFITLTFVLISMISFGQCIDCSSFEEAFIEPEKVQTIKINPWQTDITLDSIPSNIGDFVNLRILYLSDHNFSTVPPSIAQLTQQEELSFAGCQLTDVPDEVFQLTQLKELILLNNQFTPEKVEELKARFKSEMPNTQVLINAAN